MSAIDVTYTAVVSADEGAKLTIIRDVYAGISGPWGGLPEAATLGEVEQWLKDHGYTRAEDWKLTNASNGLWLEAEVVRL